MSVCKGDSNDFVRWCKHTNAVLQVQLCPHTMTAGPCQHPKLEERAATVQELLMCVPTPLKLQWKPRNVPVLSAMENAYDNCFMNAVMQALFHVPTFTGWLLQNNRHPRHICTNMDGETDLNCTICPLKHTLQSAIDNSTSNNIVIDVDGMYDKLRFFLDQHYPYQRQRVDYFLPQLLHSLEMSFLMDKDETRAVSPLRRIFEGVFCREVTCFKCDKTTVTIKNENFSMLPLKIEYTMDKAIEEFFWVKGMEENEVYNCYNCKKPAIMKQLLLYRPPNVLCVEIKRRNRSRQKNMKIKYNLDLTKFWTFKNAYPDLVLNYRLKSVIRHTEPYGFSGQSTTIGLTPTGQMFHYDKNEARLLDKTEMNMLNEARILIYELDLPKSGH